MYIKSVILDGFKSYGQRVEVSGFDPMFNAITGLNGTGKSNILDSICFVLGITNLNAVRAQSLQDLIFKSGQAGVNQATVSITFDNRNPAQCPPGFENTDEITVTRQIALGGKNKYLINGTNVTNKKVHDLFCSVQLNVNNPHFLIMQGKITKVLNMKPAEILSMVEEAAGTRMYEVKRQQTQKLIQKKDEKLKEFHSVIEEELSPKLEKLRKDREQYMEYQRTERELQHMMGLYQVWQYFEAKRSMQKAEKALEASNEKEKGLRDKIQENLDTVKQLEEDIETITTNNKSEAANELQELEVQLKEIEKQEAKVNASLKSIKDNITAEEKKKKLLEKTIATDEMALSSEEDELNKVQSLFDTLKENDRKDSEACTLAEKKYEALCAGMEVNEQGETETLAEQLMRAKEDASRASTESKQASMQLNFCQSQLKEKQKQVGSSSSDHEADEANLKKIERDVAALEASMKNINFSEDRMAQLQEHRRTLSHEVRILRERVENFEAHRPYTAFKYRDPEPNFNRNSVKGVVCKLIKCKDSQYLTALETATGGKLYNVVVDTDATCKKLLQKGDLQTRTTFIPLNKISAHKMDNNTVRLAQELVGRENCHPALSLIDYDQHLAPAMEFIFGNVFICKDINVAKKVTFHDRIRKRCVTLDGDSTDPGGILSGGARQKGESILRQLQDLRQYEGQLTVKEQELVKIENDLRQLTGVQEEYYSIKHKLDMAKHEHNLIKRRLLNTAFHMHQQEIDGLKVQIEELLTKISSCKETEKQCVAKANEIETKMRDAGYREKRLKEAEAAMKEAKKKADKSKNEWKKREQDYETLNLEIAELRKDVEATKKQLKVCEETLQKYEEEFNQISDGSGEIKGKVRELQTRIKEKKTAITEKNKEIQSKLNAKEKLLQQNTELELELKKHAHEIKELKDACKNSKFREQEYAKKMGNNNNYMKEGEALSPKEGHDLERRIKISQEKKHKLGRVVNAQAQALFDVEEKNFNEVIRKQGTVEKDKKKLLKVMQDLDEQKKNALKLAHEQVSKDFGSIFGTLLPGANAKLVPPNRKTILEGLEIKVSLGNVWKDSLTELSGGQRSLAALSLILAMLLFKPAPLYILDEVDAALDLSHTQNIGQMLRSHFKKSQFIIVSLKDGMFNNANVLFRTKFIDGFSAVQRTENTRRGQ